MAKAGKAGRVRKTLCIFLTLLALFLVGTVVVLSTVVSYFGVDWRDVITEPEMKLYERLAAQAAASDKTALRTPSDGMGAVEQGMDEEPARGERVVNGSEDDSPVNVEEYLTDLVQRGLLNSTVPRQDGASSTPQPRIPKIIHQTWKTDVLPERWDNVRKGCMDLHPD